MSKKRTPTKEDMNLVKKLDELIVDQGRYLPEWKLHHSKASQMISDHVNLEIKKVLKQKTANLTEDLDKLLERLGL